MNCPICQFANPAGAARCRACGAALQARGANGADGSDALPVGTLLAGAYAVEAVLGQGGFGITYACHDQMLDRRVAVKEFFPSGCRRHNVEVAPSRGLSDADFRAARAQFLSEARVLARCHHAGIVGVYTAFEANQTAYMVMELLSGKSLAQLLSARGGALNEAEAVGIIERVGEALGFVHEQNLLHRDIKPDNIIVCDDGRVMLIDFGTARETIQGQVQGQTVVVTPGYAPLEQYARQARRGAFTDVYSLAATLYHLLSGQMPPAASDRAMGVMLRPLREFNPGVSAGVAGAVERALQMEIDRRPQSVRKFLELLHAPVDETSNEISPALQAATGRTDLSNRKNAGAFSAPKRTGSPSVALFSDVLQPGQTQLGNLLPELKQDASEPPLNPAPIALFSDALQKHQTLVGNLMPPADSPPVQSALPRPSNSPQAAPVAVQDANGGVRVKNASVPSTGVISSWVVVGLVGFFGIMALMNMGGEQRAATPPDPVVSGAIAGSMPADMERRFRETEINRDANNREWNALPALSPASVEILPDSNKTNSPDTSNSTRNYSVRGDGVKFSPDGKRLAYIDNQAVLRVVSVPDRRVVRSLKLDKNRTSVAPMFSADNETLAVTQTSVLDSKNRSEPINRVEAWNLRNGERLGAFVTAASDDEVSVMGVLNSGQLLLQVDSPGSSELDAFLWDAKTGKSSKTSLPKFYGSTVSAVSPDEKELAFGSRDVVYWFDLKDGKQQAQYKSDLTWGDQYQRFASKYEDHIFEQTEQDSKRSLDVQSVKYSSNGQWLASRDDAVITVFDDKHRKIRELPIYFGKMDFAIASNGKWLVASSNFPMSSERELLWNVQTGERIRLELPNMRAQLSGWSFSPDSQQVYGVIVRDQKFNLLTWKANATPVKN